MSLAGFLIVAVVVIVAIVAAMYNSLVRLRVPPGAQSGRRFRIREQGAPSARDGRRGDLIVEIRLVLPAALDERSKDLLREFGRDRGTISKLEDAVSASRQLGVDAIVFGEIPEFTARQDGLMDFSVSFIPSFQTT